VIEADIIRPNEVDNVWPSIAEGMIKSCRGTNLSAGYLWTQCRAGEAFLVIVHEDGDYLGACVTRFETQPERLILRGLALCGKDTKKWLATLQDKLRQMAREGGATIFVDDGKPGLVKLIKDARVVRVVYEVDV
jgi:hypothetical protein